MITPLPALDRTSPTFKQDTDTFFGSQIPAFVNEANELQADVNTKQVTASESAQAAKESKDAAALSEQAAATSAAAAASVAGAAEWVGGRSYAAGQAVWSPVTFQTYRRAVTGAGIVDPSIDTANWAALGTSLSQLHATALSF